MPLQVQLWRSERLSGVLEVDQNLKVIKADVAAGHMLGTQPAHLQKKLLGR